MMDYIFAFSFGGVCTIFCSLMYTKLHHENLNFVEAFDDTMFQIRDSGKKCLQSLLSRWYLSSFELWDGYSIITYVYRGKTYKLIFKPKEDGSTIEPFELGFQSILAPVDFFNAGRNNN